MTTTFSCWQSYGLVADGDGISSHHTAVLATYADTLAPYIAFKARARKKLEMKL